MFWFIIFLIPLTIFGFEMETPPPLPLSVAFSIPVYSKPQYSPDGTKIAYLAPYKNALNIFVSNCDSRSPAIPVTGNQGRGVSQFFWNADNTYLVYTENDKADDNWHISAVNIQTQEHCPLTPSTVQASVLEMSSKNPQDVLIAMNDRDPRYQDLYIYNIKTGAFRKIFENTMEFSHFIIQDLKAIYAYKIDPQGNKVYYKADPSGQWHEILTFNFADEALSKVVQLKDDQTLFILSSAHTSTAAFYEYDLRIKQSVLKAQDGQADIQKVIFSPLTGQPQAVISTYTQDNWQFFDKAFEADIRLIKNLYPGNLEIVSRAAKDQKWIFKIESDTAAIQWYTFDRLRKKIDFLSDQYPALKEYQLSLMHSVCIPARDGLPLISYLTIPVAHDKQKMGIPKKPLPLIVMVHGGPWGRDCWGYNAAHQWFSSRGYAVLSVNFRGSLGLGKDILNKRNNQWGKAMHTDILDAVQWAIAQKIADPKKMSILGSSYGGYEVLMALVRSPEVFTCGIDTVGISDLNMLYKELPAFWEGLKNSYYKRIYNPHTLQGKQDIYENSAINFVDSMKKPLLIFHGVNDPRIKLGQSLRLYNKMRRQNKTVELLTFPDEGHDIIKAENIQKMYQNIEVFLKNYN